MEAYTPALQWLMQEDHEFKTILGYIVEPCLKKEKKEWKLLHGGGGR
jgi:hypothetical protein